MALLLILFLLMIFIMPIAIIALIVSSILKKKQDPNSSLEDPIKNTYCYIIIIITLFAIIVGTILIFRNGLDILLPEESLYTDYNDKQADINRNIVNVLSTLSLVITCIPIFIYHNRITKELKKGKTIENSQEN